MDEISGILERLGYGEEAKRLVLVSKRSMIALGKQQFFRKQPSTQIKQPIHPLQALQNTMAQPWKRLCISFAIRQQGHAFLPQLMSSASSSAMKSMRDFMKIYQDDIKGKLALAQEVHPDAPYTFHFVYRFTLNPNGSKKANEHKRFQKAHDGEIAVHRFVCMPDLISTLRFFQRWSVAQSLSEGKAATCLMECGPPDTDTSKRKWIIDIDAGFDDLKALGFLLDNSVCSEEDKIALHKAAIRFGSAISHYLETIGFTRSACSFALKSRHQPLESGTGYKKLSWHLTLMAFAPYSEWRKAMHCTEKNGYSLQVKQLLMRKESLSIMQDLKMDREDDWLMALLADSHILANSKGQYLQTLHSEKVEPGKAATGRRFKFEGVYRHDGMLLPGILSPESSEWNLMAYAATSLAMQDPWSVVARKMETNGVTEEEEPAMRKKTKRNASTEEGAQKKSRKPERDEDLNRWELLPKEDAAWMRGLLDVPGASFLTILPCIKDEKIMPMEVVNIVNGGRGKILFYANVVHVVLCPRYLVNGNAIHKHHNDSAVAICVSERIITPTKTEGVRNRLFVRCFSEKCLHFCRTSKAMKFPSKWEEYMQSHFIRYKRLLLAENRRAQVDSTTEKESAQGETDPAGADAT